jgi:DNA-binding CsgD family transcriptional regulator
MPPEARTARTVSVQVDAPDALLRAGRGGTDGGLSQRELDVLRLLAEGYSTVEIGRRLAYSERTIKHTLHQLTTRLALRNRVHAVAYALRAGLI